jgi:hypothetical protein
VPPKSAPCELAVAGDVVIEHHLYLRQRSTSPNISEREVREVEEYGGARVLRSLIKTLLAKRSESSGSEQSELPGWKVQPGLELPQGPPRSLCIHSLGATREDARSHPWHCPRLAREAFLGVRPIRRATAAADSEATFQSPSPSTGRRW